MPRLFLTTGLLLAAFALSHAVTAQNQSVKPDDAASELTADYPLDRAGIFIQGSSWQEVRNQMPSKSKVAHGLAASLSYGLAPAKVVAEYEGEHAGTQSEGGRPILCICHILSLPGQPVIVRLHVKKNFRELDGGKMIVYPIAGGSKMADANKSDLIPVDVAHPDPQVWLLRPQATLDPGKYALMLGTQNVNIYPFTVTASPGGAAGTK